MAKKKKTFLRRWVQSTGWFYAFLAAVAACLLVYTVNIFQGEAHPYTAWGIGYGVAATLFMVGAGLWAIRRRTMRMAPGRSQQWVQFHVYGGTVFLLLMLMHTGFRLPSGTLAWWLFLCTIVVALSGIFGVILQKTIPRILASGLAVEVHYDRIPELIEEIRLKAEGLVQTSPDAVRDFYKKDLAPALAVPQTKAIYFLDISGGIHSRLKQFDYIRRFLGPAEKEKLNELQALYKTKLEMDAHYTLQKMLRYWLYFHIPLSLLLLVLVGLHLYAVFYY
jgi:hypothetical protein